MKRQNFNALVTRRKLIVPSIAILVLVPPITHAQRYPGADGRLRVALVKQAFSPNGTSTGPNTMANGGIQQVLIGMGAVLRVEEAALTPDEATEYGGWKKLGLALGHLQHDTGGVRTTRSPESDHR